MWVLINVEEPSLSVTRCGLKKWCGCPRGGEWQLGLARYIWLISTRHPGTQKSDNKFFKGHLTYLLRKIPQHIIINEEFNCILDPLDSTGAMNPDRVQDILVDSCMNTATPQVYTHLAQQSVSGIDRMCASPFIPGRKHGIKTIPAAFTDYYAVVVLRIKLDISYAASGEVI